MKAKHLLLSSLLICNAATTFADIVKWIDKNGQVHFSDKVPQEYLDQSKSVETDHSNFIQNDNAEANEKQFKKMKTTESIRERDHEIATQKARQQEIEEKSRSEAPPKRPDYNNCTGLPNVAMEIKCRKNK